MIKFRVILEPRAEKDLKLIPKAYQKRMATALRSLALDPYVGEPLKGELRPAWSLHVWPYRIIYVITKEMITVTVVTIGHRKDVYRRLKR